MQVVGKRCTGKTVPISELEEWLRGTPSVCLKKVVLKGSDGAYA